jgi:hypothetical protein
VRAVLALTVSVVAFALGIAAFVVPYTWRRRQWNDASPDARDGLVAGVRTRQLGFVALLLGAILLVLALRLLT